jgi:hypothetical protein
MMETIHKSETLIYSFIALMTEAVCTSEMLVYSNKTSAQRSNLQINS